MNNHVCPRCDQVFPEWQPIHLVCLASRLRLWFYGLGILLILPLAFFFYQAATIGLLRLAERQVENAVTPTRLASVSEASTATPKQRTIAPTATKTRRPPTAMSAILTSTPMPQPTATATAIHKPTPTAPTVLAGTPKSVKANAPPLAIDFFIDAIEIGAETLQLHVTIIRQGNIALDWTSDSTRKGEIYLSDSLGRYDLIDMGGIFVQDLKLQPQNTYEGWFRFENPTHDSFVFHYPDMELIDINLSEFGSVEIVQTVDALDKFTVAPSPTPVTPTLVPTPTLFVCNKAIRGEFVNAWQRYAGQLGCPIQEAPVPANQILLVEQPFSKGHMFYFESGGVKFIIVKYGKGTSGTWQSYDDHWDGRNDNHCFEAQEIEPKIVRGFNLVWCSHPEIRDPLGWPLDIERDLDLELAQGFENGFILRDSDGYTNNLVYIFFHGGTYERVSNR